MLTSLDADDVARALERFSGGDWVPLPVPALGIGGENRGQFALNDLAIVRSGGGQVLSTAQPTGEPFSCCVGSINT